MILCPVCGTVAGDIFLVRLVLRTCRCGAFEHGYRTRQTDEYGYEFEHTEKFSFRQDGWRMSTTDSGRVWLEERPGSGQGTRLLGPDDVEDLLHGLAVAKVLES